MESQTEPKIELIGQRRIGRDVFLARLIFGLSKVVCDNCGQGKGLMERTYLISLEDKEKKVTHAYCIECGISGKYEEVVREKMN